MDSHREIAQSMLKHVTKGVELTCFLNRRALMEVRDQVTTYHFCQKDGYFDRYLKNLDKLDQFKTLEALCALFNNGENHDKHHSIDYEFNGVLPVQYFILSVTPNKDDV
jgi:hypothetical protein